MARGLESPAQAHLRGAHQYAALHCDWCKMKSRSTYSDAESVCVCVCVYIYIYMCVCAYMHKRVKRFVECVESI